MNKTKLLPLAAAALAIPGIGLRALHLLNGFDVDSGLPTAGSPWVWVCAVFFVLCAVLYGVLAAPLREKESVPFEKLLGTDHALFRMTAVIAGLLLIAGSAGSASPLPRRRKARRCGRMCSRSSTRSRESAAACA